MNVPQRWQRSRKAGAKQPDSCRYVGRGTQYGNRHYIIKEENDWLVFDCEDLSYQKQFITCHTLKDAHTKAVELHKTDMLIWLEHNPAWLDVLLGYKYISCFCPLDMPCHCDAIIEHLRERIKVLA